MKTFGSDLTSHVGTGSSAHCLLGQRPSRRLISSTVTGVNAVIRQSVGRITDGCSDPAVESDITYGRHLVVEERRELVCSEVRLEVTQGG